MIQDTAALDSIVAQIAFWSEFFSKLLGFVDVRAIASASQRIRCALLGSEDLANDLNAERGPDAIELDYARRRFILECRAVRVEPIDAPYTFSDVEGAVTEARYARRLGYRSKALVQPEHASLLNDALTPTENELRRARAIVEGFEGARGRGEDRALVDGLWVEVPAYRTKRAVSPVAGEVWHCPARWRGLPGVLWPAAGVLRLPAARPDACRCRLSRPVRSAS